MTDAPPDTAAPDAALRARLQQVRDFGSSEQTALLALLVSAGHVRDQVEAVCADHGLTMSQYNILRILAGGPEEGYSRGDLTCRMVDRAPDVTRLTERLSGRGLLTRCRSPHDRRVCLHAVTEKGRALLGRMRAPIEAVTSQFGTRFAPEELDQLGRLLVRCRRRRRRRRRRGGRSRGRSTSGRYP
jgi:DNA-binding MarR family transcriptional regulator